MCLISTEIESVSNTKILVAPNANNTRQLVVYSNYINNISEYILKLKIENPTNELINRLKKYIIYDEYLNFIKLNDYNQLIHLLRYV